MLGEVRWDLAWGEHAFDGGWQERPTDERRDRVAQDVSEDGIAGGEDSATSARAVG